MEVKNEITAYLENISLILLAIVLFALPLVITPITTDPFTLPKQILLCAGVLLTLLFFGARMISDGSVKIRRTPFDLPLLILGIVALISSVFSVNKFDALIAYVPFLLSILLYFLIVNFIKTKEAFSLLLISLVAGACVSTLIAILSFFKVYVFPFPFTQAPGFTTFGSILDQIIYIVLMLPIAVYLAWPIFSSLPSLLVESDNENENKNDDIFGDKLIQSVGFAIGSFILLAGIGVAVYQIVVAKPAAILYVLPFEVGFQTAFAAVSQDVGRVAQGFFFGSGFGTYSVDFTRFKQAVPFNLNEAYWSLTFFRSSSFVLELLATTGILGVVSFLFLVFKIFQRVKIPATRQNPIFFSLIFVVIASFLLPLSPILQTTMLAILAIFAVAEGLNPKSTSQFFDVELHFVAFKKGIIPFMASPVEPHGGSDLPSASTIAKIEDKSFTRALPVSFFIIFLLISSALGFGTYTYVASDILFQDSLVAASVNDGLRTYNQETNAINTFPYRDIYYRIYSQTNLALANSLASQLQEGSEASAQTQQTIINLIQQSINTARNATTISPLTSANWQNLSSIYRSLIGFGRGAEDFAVASQQQAIALDSNNPQQYIILGGIYYQLQRWDLAQQEFQRAINLKPDFANAYYNLGHTLEAQGDLENALILYQNVQRIVANTPADLEKINAEIKLIQDKIGTQSNASASGSATTGAAGAQPPLGIDTPPAQLPDRDPRVPISPPATPSAR